MPDYARVREVLAEYHEAVRQWHEGRFCVESGDFVWTLNDKDNVDTALDLAFKMATLLEEPPPMSSVPRICQLYSLTAADVAVLFKVDPRTATRWAGGYGEPTGLHRALAEALVELHSAEMERTVKRSVQHGGPMTLLLTLGSVGAGGAVVRPGVEALAKAAGLAE